MPGVLEQLAKCMLWTEKDIKACEVELLSTTDRLSVCNRIVPLEVTLYQLKQEYTRIACSMPTSLGVVEFRAKCGLSRIG